MTPLAAKLRPPDDRICPMCHGYQRVMLDVAMFGKSIPCPTCGSAFQQDYLRNICGLPLDAQRTTFSQLTRYPFLSPALDRAQALVAAPSGFFTLTGPNGRGKSTLLHCLINAGRAAGYTSVYASTADFLDHLRRAYDPAVAISYDGVMDKYMSATILCLDELDAFKASAWAEEKFRQLIDHRYQDRLHKLTAFATNARPEDLPPYLFSRMSDRESGAIYEIAGADLRRI